jgi:hypothetical protein
MTVIENWMQWMRGLEEEMRGYFLRAQSEQDVLMAAYWDGNCQALRIARAKMEAAIRFPEEEES